jgi:hypothetical protein
MTPLFAGFDFAVGRAIPGRYSIPKPLGTRHELTDQTILTMLPKVVEPGWLRPQYDSTSLNWLLARLAEKTRHGQLVKMEVEKQGAGTVGWFVYLAQPRALATVVQVGALPEHRDIVLDHLIHDAWSRGVAAVTARLDRFFAAAVSQRQFSLTLAQPWSVAHSRLPELKKAFDEGRMFFSRLDAEWWLSC